MTFVKNRDMRLKNITLPKDVDSHVKKDGYPYFW
jgi:hypothetical protein